MIKFLRKYYDLAYLYTTAMVNTDISRILNCTQLTMIYSQIFEQKIISLYYHIDNTS